MAKMYIESLLGENERILLTARQHWFLLASAIFFEITLILFLFAASITASYFYKEYVLWIAIAGFLLILIPITTMTRDILVWSNHQYLITNWRVMQVSGILNKSVIDSSLEKVNDVKMTQSALGRMFGFGDIEILTASELGVNMFKYIDEPVRFKTAMINAKSSAERREEPRPLAPDIPAMIVQLDDLRKKGIISEEEFTKKKAELLAKL
jgi:uncharacterized membrane protein YdbT with pleckstrin-like domain